MYVSKIKYNDGLQFVYLAYNNANILYEKIESYKDNSLRFIETPKFNAKVQVLSNFSKMINYPTLPNKHLTDLDYKTYFLQMKELLFQSA